MIQSKRFLQAIYHYFLFFMLVSFVTTCCMEVFISALCESIAIPLNEENISKAAKLTFVIVLLLSFLFTVIDSLRRKYTVKKPIQWITNGAEKMIQGDFSVRIQKENILFVDSTFDTLIDCFNRMAQELQGIETLRTDFIANVSHEMKTPLAIIQNYATLLQNCTNEKEKSEYTRAIGQTVNKMSNMITNILKLNQLENQQIYPQIKEFDLSEQLCTSLLQYETVWESKDIEISTEIEDDVYIQADQELLSLVWNNLLSNAFKFTPAQGKVSVRLIDENDYVLVQVEDTGCGMSAEIGKHIFEKFYQADRSHATQGNGLGLALVKKVIDIVQGEISVVSKIHVGTTFSVKLAKRVHEL